MVNRLILRDLLLLQAGALDAGTAANVRKEIEQTPNCQRVFELVNRVSAELDRGPGTSEILMRTSDVSFGLGMPSFELDAEVVAAYLDGNLEKEQRKQLERNAIREPRLLRELLLHFRQQFAAGDECLVPWSATEKLLQLGRGLEKNLAVEKSRPFVVASALSPIAATARPVEIQMARAVSVASSPKQTLGRRRLKLAVAIALTAGLLGAIWITGGLGRWLASPDKTNELASSRKLQVEGSNVVQGPNRSGGERGFAADSSRIKRPKSIASSGDWVLVTLEDPLESAPAGEGALVDPGAAVFHQQSGVLEDLTWLKLEGIVALREQGKGTWFGPRSSARIFNGLEWQTLPGSWVSARLGDLGEIVLDADSSVAVSVISPEHMIGLDMQAGRVGLKKLSAQSKLKVKYGRFESEIEVLADGTALGFDWLDGAPRLSVYGGSVRTMEQIVSGRQQLVWSDSPKSGGNSREFATGLSPLIESFAWLESPVKVNTLSETDQAELLASSNVVNSLNRLGADRPASERVLAQYLPAVLSPEVHLLSVLEGEEQTSREEALQWLMGLSPRSPKTRQLWRTIAEKSGAPEHSREFFRLVQLARNSAPVNELDARFLTSGLKHERLFVREMSQLLLEYGFGNTVHYDAAAEPANRNSAADQWTREILQSYLPTGVPKR